MSVRFEAASTNYSRGATMGARISKTFEISTFLSWSLALIPLLTCSRPGRGSEACVERRTSSPPKTQNPMLTESGPQTPDDAQVKAVLDKMAAAGITRPTTVADVRKAYLFYPKLSGTPEHVFHIDDRQIPGPACKVTVRIYTPNPTQSFPILVFFHLRGGWAGPPSGRPPHASSCGATAWRRQPIVYQCL